MNPRLTIFLALAPAALAMRSLPGQRLPVIDTVRQTRVSPSGMLYVLHEERFAGSPFTQSYPRPKHECFHGGGPLIQSGWIALRGSWWVVLDTIATCPTENAFHLAIRVDSGIVGGTADGRGWVFMRRVESPLPGPAAVLRQSFSYVDPHRFSDTVTLFGADSSHVRVYVRSRAP
jgi:hypothetical protein